MRTQIAGLELVHEATVALAESPSFNSSKN